MRTDLSSASVATLPRSALNFYFPVLISPLSQRPKILVFNWCYHGSVDETFITLLPDGSTKARVGNTGPPVDPNVTTRVRSSLSLLCFNWELAGVAESFSPRVSP